MKLIVVLSLGLLTLGCASLSPQTKTLIDSKKGNKQVQLKAVPFYPQKDGDCGPSALKMVLNWADQEASIDQIRSLVLTPKKSGSLPAEMLAAPRQFSLMTVPISTLIEIVSELDTGRPVIVMQNLGFSWAPVWHYAVVVGYDLKKQEFILHSGEEEYKTIPMTYFERHWELADHWGFVVFPAGELSASASEIEHMKSAAALESIGKNMAAKRAYLEILKKWPQSLMALIGLGNLAFKEGMLDQSAEYFRQAVQWHPNSKAAQHNLDAIKSYKKAKK